MAGVGRGSHQLHWRRCAIACALSAWAAAPAQADLLSPGSLSRPHEKLDGLKNCTQCHAAGAQLSPERCLQCHQELKVRIEKGQGFHGHLAPAQRSCNSCHHEHQGRDFALLDWGPGGKRGFDHARTGFVLRGKHVGTECGKCHRDELIADPAVRALQKEQPKRKTLLGLSLQCTSCHFDEHRAQLEQDCARCHVEKSWKPAPGFAHERTAFALRGGHAKVACKDCHAAEHDAAPAEVRPGLTRPIAETFARFKPVTHASCLDCHKDPHEGKLGSSCTQCHTEKSWHALGTSATERAFHEKTRYPLRGAHFQVPCKSCHGPAPGKPQIFKGMKFAACADCHADAHEGQLVHAPPGPGPACDSCHTVDSFLPARFEPGDHARTRYPLEGAHAAVACLLCHLPEPKLLARTEPVAAKLRRQHRAANFSAVSFEPKGAEGRCESCHTDPHQGQLAGRAQGCAGCHRVESFHQLKFEHDRDSRFPLAGKHAQVACESCHLAEAKAGAAGANAAGAGALIRYKPLEVACASCHADPHAAQFAPAAGAATDCTRCHVVKGWKETLFVHQAPFTTFALQGKHAPLACASCHAEVAVAPGVLARRYRGVPVTCEGCHQDFHRGAFSEGLR